MPRTSTTRCFSWRRKARKVASGGWARSSTNAGCSPQARGRSERAFRTHQDRLPKELALAGVTDMEAANRYLAAVYLPAFNQEFMRPPMEEGSAFVAWVGADPYRHPVRAVRAHRG